MTVKARGVMRALAVAVLEAKLWLTAAAPFKRMPVMPKACGCTAPWPPRSTLALAKVAFTVATLTASPTKVLLKLPATAACVWTSYTLSLAEKQPRH